VGKFIIVTRLGQYRCIARNEFGDVVSECQLTVLAKPYFMQGLEDREVIEGAGVMMDVVLAGSPVPDVRTTDFIAFLARRFFLCRLKFIKMVIRCTVLTLSQPQ